MKQISARELNAIQESAYKKCFEDWKSVWLMCFASNGEYLTIPDTFFTECILCENLISNYIQLQEPTFTLVQPSQYTHNHCGY